MKFCTTCGQQIQDAALLCRYCKHWQPGAGLPGAAQAPPYPLATLNGAQATSGLAIASLVLGILWIYWIGSIVGLVLGYLALREIRRNPRGIEGKGMATAGIILGWVAMATLLLAIAAGIYIWKTNQHPGAQETGPSRAGAAHIPGFANEYGTLWFQVTRKPWYPDRSKSPTDCKGLARTRIDRAPPSQL